GSLRPPIIIIKLIKPTRPININTIKTPLLISFTSPVIPNDNPQVPNADITSKNACKNETFPFSTTSRSEEHTSELQSRFDLVCRLLLEKKKKNKKSVT